jgi:uncharacterized protein (TIGR02421 family)
MEHISDSFIKATTKTLNRGKQVHRRLPDGGLLYIDRPLPFLLLFRHPVLKPDHATANLVKASASYIISHEANTPELSKLINQIAATMADKFGAFMILELFTTPDQGSLNKHTPLFRILGPEQKLPATIRVLRQELEAIHLNNLKTSVEISSNQKLISGPLQLMNEEDLKKNSCLMLGIEIKPIYSDASGNTYPLLLRTLRSKLAEAIQKTVFDFVSIQTTHKPAHFQALGRHAVSRVVWRIDKQLSAINRHFHFLLLVTPVNNTDAWEEFQKANFKKQPTFHYRLMPVDTDLLKRKLYNIPIEKIPDPTLSYLFNDKRKELDKILSMLSDRNTPDFLYSSMQLFGSVDEQLLQIANKLMATYPEPGHKKNDPLITVEEFAALAEKEIAFLKQQYSGVNSGVSIRKDIVGLIVSEGRLNVGTDAKIPRSRAEALIQHEVGTHILTYFNGKAQPLHQLYVGTPGYEELQEGLAVLSEYLVGGLDQDRIRMLAARVITVYHLTKGAGFVENFCRLKEEYLFDDETAFDITMRVHRGGGLTKDAVYLRGLVHLLDYLKEGNELEPLLIGKIRQDYIPIVQELIYRRVLRPAPLTPRYLLNPDLKPKLEQLKTGISVFNLL